MIDDVVYDVLLIRRRKQVYETNNGGYAFVSSLDLQNYLR